MKMHYAKLLDNGQLDRYNGKHIKTDKGTVFNPTAETLAANGYMPLPNPDHTRPILSWTVVDGALTPTYGEPPPPKPRVFSKMKVVAALMKAGLWPQVKAWIEQVGLYDLYLAAQNFGEDNEYFEQGLAQLKSQLSLTDGQVEGILAECIAED